MRKYMYFELYCCVRLLEFSPCENSPFSVSRSPTMLAYRLSVLGLIVVSLCVLSSYCTSETAGSDGETTADDVPVKENSEKGSVGGGKTQPEKLVVAFVPDYPSK